MFSSCWKYFDRACCLQSFNRFSVNGLQADQARKHLAGVIAAKNVKSGDDMADIIKHTKHTLEVMDDWWAIEDSLLASLVGTTAEARAGAVIMAMLPDEDKELQDKKAVLTRLQTLQSSQQMTMSPISVQASLKYVVKTLSSMVLGIPLLVNTDEITRMAADCVGTFEFFLQRDILDEKEEQPDVISGETCFRHILTCAKLTLDAEKPVPEDDCADLALFRWLCPAEMEPILIEVLARLQSGVPKAKKAKAASAAAAAVSVSGAASSASGSKKKETNKQKARDAAMSLFT